MKALNLIGLDKEKSKELVNHLNDLLANYQIFYQNLRGFHWNVKGSNFFELHAKFEEYYNDAIDLAILLQLLLIIQILALAFLRDHLK